MDDTCVSLDTVNINTPVNFIRLREMLEPYLDREKVKFVLQGFEYGFRIGVEKEMGPGSSRNNRSALGNKIEVSRAIQKEVNNGCLAGPFKNKPCVPFHCSPISAVAKPDKSVRLLLDMSSPRGDALNEAIDPLVYSCHYSHLDNAVGMVKKLGRGAYLCKIDLKNAFRICPVNRKDWWLLGFKWEGMYYVYIKLPYGSRHI